MSVAWPSTAAQYFHLLRNKCQPLVLNHRKIQIYQFTKNSPNGSIVYNVAHVRSSSINIILRQLIYNFWLRTCAIFHIQVVVAPKTLLRDPRAVSKLEDMVWLSLILFVGYFTLSFGFKLFLPIIWYLSFVLIWNMVYRQLGQNLKQF